MSTYYSPGCNNEKAHVCDCCHEDDGRPTLYWQKKSFDLCHECLKSIFVAYIDPKLKLDEGIDVRRQAIPEKLRNKIFQRDGDKCLHCGSTESLELDHIIPFIRGGKTEESNLQTLCRSCNSKKRAR